MLRERFAVRCPQRRVGGCTSVFAIRSQFAFLLLFQSFEEASFVTAATPKRYWVCADPRGGERLAWVSGKPH